MTFSCSQETHLEDVAMATLPTSHPEDTAASPEQALPFQELNVNASVSVLFIHGAFVSRSDWDLVTPYLPGTHHILLPDLPGHGEAHSILPFSKHLSARLLADLIRKHGKCGKAHLVGLSLGASVAIELASTYPNVVNDVFVTGCSVFKPSPSVSRYMPRLVWLEQRLENRLPRPFVRWLMDGADIRASPEEHLTTDLIGSIVTELSPSSPLPKPWPARTLIVAATKAGIVPSNDSIEAATAMLEIGQQGNAETVAFKHPQMRHPWNRQDPELFAETVIAWFKKQPIPDGFEKL